MGGHSAWDTLTWSAIAGTTKTATFAITTPGVSGERALLEARVNFYLNHRWCGEGSRNLDVRRDAGVAPLTDIALPPLPPWRTGLTLEADASPPDLIVRIQRGESVGEYTWSCLSPHVEFTIPADPRATQMALREDAATFVRRTFGPLANVSLKKLSIGAVQGAGEGLYRTTPTHFKDSYWAVWDAASEEGFPFESIQIVTDEPFIPWELMRIYDTKRGAGVPPEFLAIRHSVGRWLADESAGPPQRIPVSDVVVAASDYVGITAVSNTLPWAKEEREMLVNTHHATSVPLTSGGVLHLLETGYAQAVHFACHGRMSIGDPNASQLVMEDTPDDVTPLLVARAEVCEGLGARRPLVFLNACEVGGSAAALSLVAGFPGAFLYAGASALISPLWVVNDAKACEIAKAFYGTVSPRRIERPSARSCATCASGGRRRSTSRTWPTCCMATHWPGSTTPRPHPAPRSHRRHDPGRLHPNWRFHPRAVGGERDHLRGARLVWERKCISPGPGGWRARCHR